MNVDSMYFKISFSLVKDRDVHIRASNLNQLNRLVLLEMQRFFPGCIIGDVESTYRHGYEGESFSERPKAHSVIYDQEPSERQRAIKKKVDDMNSKESN